MIARLKSEDKFGCDDHKDSLHDEAKPINGSRKSKGTMI
jgi:hypothetical protein